MDCSDWTICAFCKSEDYIDPYFPEDHWAYLSFKTQDRNEYQKHVKSAEHLDHYKHLKCIPCNHQLWNQREYDAHIHTLSHRRKAKIDYHCDACDMKFEFESQFNIHNNTQKHKDKVSGIEKQTVFRCEDCDYESVFKHHYDQHCNSKKHQNRVNGIEKPNSYHCEKCDYSTHTKGGFEQHCKGKKHNSRK